MFDDPRFDPEQRRIPKMLKKEFLDELETLEREDLLELKGIIEETLNDSDEEESESEDEEDDDSEDETEEDEVKEVEDEEEEEQKEPPVDVSIDDI